MRAIRHFGRCESGATLVEFALVALPVLFFVFCLMQTAYIVWVDNLMQTAVNTAARCGSVPTNPCNMLTTATQVFAPLTPQTGMFVANTCTDGVGLVATYDVTIGLILDLRLIARSCYPTIPTPPPPA